MDPQLASLLDGTLVGIPSSSNGDPKEKHRAFISFSQQYPDSTMGGRIGSSASMLALVCYITPRRQVVVV